MILFYKKPYTVELIVEKGGYVASLKEQSNAISQGDTIEEAVQGLFNILEVIDDLKK